jgi:hypothetical protein
VVWCAVQGSFDIIHLKDKKGVPFATRSGNVFIIGDADKAWISLPKAKGQRSTILEERAERNAAKQDKKKSASPLPTSSRLLPCLWC